MADQPQQCTGADDPRERCGRHHPLAVLDGRTCCCDDSWLPAKDQCFSGAGEGDRVSLGIKLEAMLGYTVADAPQDIAAHVEGVMDILAQHTTASGDYRQRITDALTATCPRHSLFDGNCPRCDERLDAVLAVRDQDAETLRSDNEELRKRADAAEADARHLRTTLSVVEPELARLRANVEQAVCVGCMEREHQRELWAERSRQNGISYKQAKQRWYEAKDRAEDAEQEVARAETVIDDLVQLVRDLADLAPCEDFDHHGHCQTHGWLQDSVCPHARARDILTAQDAGENRG